MKILSWNVNGIRAVYRKGFIEWFGSAGADILCLQETKASIEQLTEDIIKPDGYVSFWNGPERKGYAGVAAYSRDEPLNVFYDFPSGALDTEGRFLGLEFPGVFLINVYFPNGGASPERLQYKLDFYDRFIEYLSGLKKKNVLLCGDLNTAHREIDLARPKQNRKVSGFLPEECEKLDRLEDSGFIDTFRRLHPEEVKYSWWDYKTRARERNVGWRIDYFFATENVLKKTERAFIMNKVTGSDHCPVGVELGI